MSEDAEETITEVWAYAGVRLDRDGKLVDEWYADSGNSKDSYWFAKKAGRNIIGGLYEVNVLHRDNGRISRVGEPSWTGSSVDNDKRQTWSMLDSTARTLYQTKRNHINAAKEDALDEAMAPLQALAAKCRTSAERDAFIATVLRRLWQA